MDIKSGNPYPSGALSNFSAHPFQLDGVDIVSMEGFLQSLKFKDPNMQREICKYAGLRAKRAGKDKNWRRTQTLWWLGEEIDRHSPQYQELLDRAYETMFTTNEKAKKALLSTGSANLTHSVGKRKASDTILTTQEFCSRLMNIRDTLNAEACGVDFVD